MTTARDPSWDWRMPWSTRNLSPSLRVYTRMDPGLASHMSVVMISPNVPLNRSCHARHRAGEHRYIGAPRIIEKNELSVHTTKPARAR